MHEQSASRKTHFVRARPRVALPNENRCDDQNYDTETAGSGAKQPLACRQVVQTQQDWQRSLVFFGQPFARAAHPNVLYRPSFKDVPFPRIASSMDLLRGP